jgi:hypothetical protein
MEDVSKGALENRVEDYGAIVDLWGSEPNKYITREVSCKNVLIVWMK